MTIKGPSQHFFIELPQQEAKNTNTQADDGANLKLALIKYLKDVRCLTFPLETLTNQLVTFVIQKASHDV